MLDSGRPIVVPVLMHEPMALSELTDPDAWQSLALSLVSVPLSLGAQVVGALSIYFERPPHEADFSARIGVLQVVATQLAQALQASTAASSDERRGEARDRSDSGVFEYSNMIGSSGVMRQVYEQIGQVARTNATALIRGESGTGKELVAQAIHGNSPRARQPFVKVNCAALPETLFESELFGHERGAFTGAHTRKVGRFELVRGGTLFLDEVGELPLSTQVKLLRVLQSREFERLGGTETIKSDARLIAATNRDLERAISEGAFREDLYYRLNVFSITMPPLRERPADIPTLAEYFLAKYAGEHGKRITRFANSALDALCAHGWAGNVRELENVIERAVVICDEPVVDERNFPEAIRTPTRGRPQAKPTLAEAVEMLERRMLEEALRDARGNLARAARALGATERIVRYKVGKYGIPSSRFR